VESCDAPDPTTERGIVIVTENPSMTDLMAAVGQFLLCWGWLESTLGSRPLPDDLEPIRSLRNTICHGMRSAHADAGEEASKAYIECCSLDGKLVKFSFQDLHAAFLCLEKARITIG
jgi:hypothetical protein